MNTEPQPLTPSAADRSIYERLGPKSRECARRIEDIAGDPKFDRHAAAAVLNSINRRLLEHKQGLPGCAGSGAGAS